MEPIGETVEVAQALESEADGVDIVGALLDMSEQVRALVPSCIGLSVAWIGDDVAFTVVATDEEIAQLDAVQYLEDGPCVDSAWAGTGVATHTEDLLDEDKWQLFGLATAAHGVRSTVTFPVVDDDDATVGTVNLYAARDDAFDPHIDELAAILGAWAPGVVRNSDLSFATRRAAELAPTALEARRTVDVASGLVAARYGTDVAEARERLDSAASRAGISTARFAEALLQLGLTP